VLVVLAARTGMVLIAGSTAEMDDVNAEVYFQ
jgi:hypothetical protein